MENYQPTAFNNATRVQYNIFYYCLENLVYTPALRNLSIHRYYISIQSEGDLLKAPLSKE